LESVEIGFKAVICGHMALKYGSHWHEDRDYFFNTKEHREFLKRLKFELSSKQETETFLKHYTDKYDTPERPPSWMIFEIISLGATSKLFDNLKFRKDQKRISSNLEIPPEVCGSWLHSLTTLRNTCAHHSRLWNRHFPFTAAIPNRLKEQWANTDKLYDYIWILKNLLKAIHRDSEWLNNLKILLQEGTEVDKARMGFGTDWNSDSIWDD